MCIRDRIKSVAENLATLLKRPVRASDWEEDMQRGLVVIATRSDSLARFMNAYARLARLPPPALQTMEVGPWIRRVAGLEPRMQIGLEAGPELKIHADPDQLEQLLINLVHNAVDASDVYKRQGRFASHATGVPHPRKRSGPDGRESDVVGVARIGQGAASRCSRLLKRTKDDSGAASAAGGAEQARDGIEESEAAAESGKDQFEKRSAG